MKDVKIEGGSLLTRPTEIVKAFIRFNKEIAKALRFSHGMVEYDELLRDCISGKKMLWLIGDESFVITYVTREGNLYFLVAPFCGGNLEELLSHKKSFVEYAHALGCKGILFGGRKGWEKVFKAKSTNQIYLEI